MKHILLSGRRNSGKTALFNRLLARCRMPVYGFLTGITETDPQGWHQVHMLPADGSPGEPTGENFVCRCNTRQREVNLRVFETLGVRLLDAARPDGILVMDELGFIEADAPTFCDRVFRRLDGDIPILATVRDATLECEFLDRVRAHPRAALYNVTPDGAEALYEQLLPVVEGWNEVLKC
jgi:nucleoside-triphosphatase